MAKLGFKKARNRIPVPTSFWSKSVVSSTCRPNTSLKHSTHWRRRRPENWPSCVTTFRIRGYGTVCSPLHGGLVLCGLFALTMTWRGGTTSWTVDVADMVLWTCINLSSCYMRKHGFYPSRRLWLQRRSYPGRSEKVPPGRTACCRNVGTITRRTWSRWRSYLSLWGRLLRFCICIL